MKKEELRLGGIPGLLYTVQADRVFLFVHGKGGNKEEALLLSEIACEKGWDVVGIDLPGWGARTAEAARFVPWEAAPELRTVYEELKRRYNEVALYANSIGAYFSLLALGDKALARALFVSPVTDMERLIRRMMGWASAAGKRGGDPHGIRRDPVLALSVLRQRTPGGALGCAHPDFIRRAG